MNDLDSMLMEKEEYEIMYRNEDKFWWYKGLQHLLLHYIKKYCTKDCLILDAGCGTGKNLEIFIKNGFNVRGIDLSKDAIVFCNLRGLKDVKICSIDKIDYPSNYFNVIYCMDVLGILDIDKRNNSIKEFKRILKKDGILIIQCAALEWLRSQHDDVVSIKKRFKRREIIELLENNGFKLIKCSYRVFFLFPIIALVKIIKKILKNKNGNATSDQWMPPKLINSFLFFLQLLENYLFFIINLPIGSSVFAIAMKK